MTPPPTELADRLRRAGVADVDGSPATRATHAADASLYRVVPRVVVAPRDADDVVATVQTCRELGVPLTGRGAGTSIAGNAVGAGVVLDCSRHLDDIVDVTSTADGGGRAIVEPGVVLDHLQRAAAPHGLRFGPDPSSHDRATLGGMIGNNACGSRALGYGRTVDQVVTLDVVLADGTRVRLGRGADAATGDGAGSAARAARLVDDVVALRDRHGDVIADEFGRFTRQASGYGLQHLLGDGGPHLARAFVGSEGTLGIVVAAEVELVAAPDHTRLVVVGHPDMPSAADTVVDVLDFDPVAVEGLDTRITDALRRRRGPESVPPLPAGGAWLLVELAGDDLGEVDDRARRLVAAAGGPAVVVNDPVQVARIWRIREDGAGLAAVAPSGRPAHAGWEDAAVPPEGLGDYLRAFDDLLDEFGLTGLPYGHMGEGCVHVRLDFPLREPDGLDLYARFVRRAADLAVAHGGSLSGEHGDGRARSDLLARMYSPDALAAMTAFKHAFDPEGLLNPGVLATPARLTADLRADGAAPVPATDGFAFTADGGDVTAAAHRCTGVGACVADRAGTGTVMCPSWQATGRELDSTRGRAHVLQEMLRGEVVTGGWASPEVDEALDLCLACKGCASDCPTGVDMARLKAEVLHRRHREGRRPRSHHLLGALPRWSDLAALAPGVANAVLDLPMVSSVARRVAGIDPRRALPSFASTTFRESLARRRAAGGPLVRPEVRRAASTVPGAGPVVLWVDSFTDHFAPEAAVATLEVLVAAGHEVEVVTDDACCGLTWISTGQLDEARIRLRSTVEVLSRHGGGDAPIVGVEPSCVAVLRDDLVDLLEGDDAARSVAARARTLAEVLAARRPDWTPPRLDGRTLVVQPHCHHHAVMGFAADRALLAATGADLVVVGGCCGLAGNWGMEQGHHDLSLEVAGLQLLPALEAAPRDAVVLADGFSCRTQVAALGSRRARHLAEVLRPR
ncbi:FAD-binding and (Fe-S)-binding domain-containing protein [Salsipaludibacter albus]|uniref:FAD-binding and (Fe-S)-binding domain-containing protein n=1 Tax=Salsipaludibacter albus TaxID=2849650 RepID=UPI001EE3F965|nr:FAD-binding oxidoreductase [Salsipaludibacter albus]